MKTPNLNLVRRFTTERVEISRGIKRNSKIISVPGATTRSTGLDVSEQKNKMKMCKVQRSEHAEDAFREHVEEPEDRWVRCPLESTIEFLLTSDQTSLYLEYDWLTRTSLVFHNFHPVIIDVKNTNTEYHQRVNVEVKHLVSLKRRRPNTEKTTEVCKVKGRGGGKDEAARRGAAWRERENESWTLCAAADLYVSAATEQSVIFAVIRWSKMKKKDSKSHSIVCSTSISHESYLSSFHFRSVVTEGIPDTGEKRPWSREAGATYQEARMMHREAAGKIDSFWYIGSEMREYTKTMFVSSEVHDQDSRRGPPNNKLRVTDCPGALESALLYPDSHHVLSHQDIRKRLFSCTVYDQAHERHAKDLRRICAGFAQSRSIDLDPSNESRKKEY
ncbi:hypothetical protein WN51_10795 [Melipona quadrifasciata]|uniref:Uncharacterized protein n=1 Tax=Melipona quadrifasciata TaxID=166423 RepID=A0A0M9A6M7_9HYME|nr:hypothetical protein WN51_10795 [Melipona quadrifasciata]